MDEHQQAVARTIYDTMVAAHTDRFGAPSVKMRHYLHGQGAELTARMGLRRELLAQPEDSPETLMSVPVEERWDEERRSRGQHQTPEGKPWPVRRWREVQIIRSAPLPTEKDWR